MKHFKLAAVELEDWEQEIFRRRFPYATVSPKQLNQVSDLQKIEMLVSFIHSPITKDVLDRMPALKFISTMSTGFDHIDMAACRQRGIQISNVPSYGENTVAEHAFALLLALTKNLVPSVERTRAGSFNLDELRGIDLAGKTIGVVGTGRIGQHVIKIAKGFGMQVAAYDVHPNQEVAAQLGYSYVDLERLLQQSQFVTLHAPATKETHHLLNETRLRMMLKDAYLINTARGSLIDTQALLRVLSDGLLAGVGLDVLEEEGSIREERELLSAMYQEKCDPKTLVADHVLLDHPRVLITPHNAFNTREALERILNTTIKNVEAFEQGQPINLVT